MFPQQSFWLLEVDEDGGMYEAAKCKRGPVFQLNFNNITAIWRLKFYKSMCWVWWTYSDLWLLSNVISSKLLNDFETVMDL